MLLPDSQRERGGYFPLERDKACLRKSPSSLHTLCLQFSCRLWEKPLVNFGSSLGGIVHKPLIVLQLPFKFPVLQTLDCDCISPLELC